MEKVNLLAAHLSANPRLVWLLTLLTLMALGLAAGAADGFACGNSAGC